MGYAKLQSEMYPPALKIQQNPLPAGRVLRRVFRSAEKRQRCTMTNAEALLGGLLQGTLLPLDYCRVMPFHCLDQRYKKCRAFMERFYPAGYGGFAPGPTIGALADSVETLCFLTADGPALTQGPPIAVIVGEHEDCGFTKMETGSDDCALIERRTLARTDEHTETLFRKKNVSAAIRGGRLSLLITKTIFCREKAGSYSVLYTPMPQRTNRLLERCELPILSRDFCDRFDGTMMIFGNRARRRDE